MNTNYDVMILGTGEAGIYAAYELSLKCPSARVLVVDQGADIYRRQCPIVAVPAKRKSLQNYCTPKPLSKNQPQCNSIFPPLLLWPTGGFR